MDYAQLQADIAAELMGRDDLGSVIPRWIRFAEGRLNRELRVGRMLERAVATLDNQYIALPPDWLEARNVQINTTPARPLQYVTPVEADRIRHHRGGAAGEPYYYTVFGTSLEVIPAPASPVDIELVYYAKLPALSDAHPTNWLLETWPDLLFYGALVYSAPYLHDDERLVTWDRLFQDALASAHMADQRGQYSGSTLRVRTRKLGV